MRDIFGRDIVDGDMVAFPFLKRDGYKGSKTSVYLSYGIIKGERAYTIDDSGKFTYKSMKNAEGMALILREEDLSDSARKKLEDIRVNMNKKKK